MKNKFRAFKLKIANNSPKLFRYQSYNKENMAYLNEAFNSLNPAVIQPNSLKNVPHKKRTYGFECKICKGCSAYHMSVQNKNPHPYVKGSYREFLPYECGPFYVGGTPFIN